MKTNIFLIFASLVLIFIYSCNTEVEYLEKGEVEKAIEYCNKQDTATQANCFMNVANYYYSSEAYKDAAIYFEKAGDLDSLNLLDSCLREVVKNYKIDKKTDITPILANKDKFSKESTKNKFQNLVAFDLWDEGRIDEAAKILHATDNKTALHFVARTFVKKNDFDKGIALFTELGVEKEIKYLEKIKENMPTLLQRMDKPITSFCYRKISEEKLLNEIDQITQSVDYIEAIDLITATFLNYSSEVISEYMKSIKNPNRSNRKTNLLQAKADVTKVLIDIQKKADQKLMNDIKNYILEHQDNK